MSIEEPRDQMLDVGDRRLFVQESGTGEPVVLLEAGFGGYHTTWNSIWEPLSAWIRVCRYDRANLGRSDPVDGPRSLRDAVSDAVRVIEAVAGGKSLIIVGHSLGGAIALALSGKIRANIAGVVLLDAYHPDWEERVRAALPAKKTDPPEYAELPWRQAAPAPDAPDNPEHFLWSAVDREVKEVRSLGCTPLLVVSRMRPPPGAPFPKFYGDTLSSCDKAHAEALHEQVQRELAQLSVRGDFLLLAGAGHYLHRDRPFAVSSQILRMISEMRRPEAR